MRPPRPASFGSAQRGKFPTMMSSRRSRAASSRGAESIAANRSRITLNRSAQKTLRSRSRAARMSRRRGRFLSRSIVPRSMPRRARSAETRARRARSPTRCGPSCTASMRKARSIARSSLATWLRAVIAQRHIDGVRGERRFEALYDAAASDLNSAPAEPSEPGHARMMEIFTAVLSAAIATLSGKDRMRLGYYYRDELTLREIARATGEHESTVSRNLERTRRELRDHVERDLRKTHRMSAEQIQLCYESASEHAPFKLGAVISPIDAGATTQKKQGSSF